MPAIFLLILAPGGVWLGFSNKIEAGPLPEAHLPFSILRVDILWLIVCVILTCVLLVLTLDIQAVGGDRCNSGIFGGGLRFL